MKTARSEHVCLNCFECQKNTNLWTHVLKCSFHARTGKSMNHLLSYYGLVVARISASEKDLPVSGKIYHRSMQPFQGSQLRSQPMQCP